MRDLSKDLINKNISYEKLLLYGFINLNNDYEFQRLICDNKFKVIVQISAHRQISKVVDLSTDEEYTLVDVSTSSGSFVGKVRDEYESIINDILKQCTSMNVFKSEQSIKVIKYVKEKYSDDLEYLWEKFSNNAVWRNKVNNKWYGALLIVSENKLGLASDKVVEIIDLRYQKDMISDIIDDKKIFKGYHMNKNSWITIRLDGSVALKEIYRLIDNSYNLSLEK